MLTVRLVMRTSSAGIDEDRVAETSSPRTLVEVIAGCRRNCVGDDSGVDIVVTHNPVLWIRNG
jgi:hypothetical protein